MSPHGVHVSTYWLSSCIHVAKSTLERPLTCQMHVIPGLTVNRRNATAS